MTKHVYTPALNKFVTAFQTGGSTILDLRAALLTTTTTADTETGVALMNGFTTLGEKADGSYARVALTGETIATDGSEVKVTASATAFGSLDQGADANVLAVLVFNFITDDTDSWPFMYTDEGGFNPPTGIPMNGSAVTVTWNITGVYRLKNAA